MDIKSVLDERVIDLNMTAKNKKEAIEHLAGKLKMLDILRMLILI